MILHWMPVQYLYYKIVFYLSGNSLPFNNVNGAIYGDLHTTDRHIPETAMCHVITK